jgi:predicted nucleic-acid-binding Zn-ribbon protein
MGLFSGARTVREDQAARFLAAGMEVACPQCHNNLFRSGRAQLNTAALSFLNLDWANRSATTLVCSQCSLVSWFLEAPARLD